jgi:hypothetical protein
MPRGIAARFGQGSSARALGAVGARASAAMPAATVKRASMPGVVAAPDKLGVRRR